ncbi:hypothetical protein [Microcoleus sp. S13_C5]|uniref:hypothetical protein n=1 Tax=Microcoleus sp. S13_C5 TaxID=3055411 RepID=UPI002FD76B5E
MISTNCSTILGKWYQVPSERQPHLYSQSASWRAKGIQPPSIRESEQYKKAINSRKSLSELGRPDLEYPFEILLAKIESLLQQKGR